MSKWLQATLSSLTSLTSLTSKIMNQIARWWHGKGFGIQSRSDYEYLKDVIKEPLPYYAYEQIKSERARLIYRVLQPPDKERKVILVGMFTPENRRLHAWHCTTSQTLHHSWHTCTAERR